MITTAGFGFLMRGTVGRMRRLAQQRDRKLKGFPHHTAAIPLVMTLANRLVGCESHRLYHPHINTTASPQRITFISTKH